ncbi:MAG: tRNA lysidine(34) synthetase TilS [Terrimonas sp.]|nr:tRNA lysidine(34) synthetase TilS [Terrimonas sp.]
MLRLEDFISFIQEQKLFADKNRLLLAVSGGVDSVVLCHLCRNAGFDFMIAHCNFQLRGPESERDEQFVKALADHYAVPFLLKRFDTQNEAWELKKSVEETARELRYAWFRQILEGEVPIPSGQPAPDLVLTAHHADDNIETVLMNFFRGTGIKGLRGMQPRQNKLIRPLLFARKKELEAYAREHQLDYVTDSSNAAEIFTRNFFRNTLIPRVKEYFPAAEENILQNISRWGEAEILYQEAVEGHKRKLMEQRGDEYHIPVLKLKKSVPLVTLVYEIIKDFGFSAPQVQEVIALLDRESGKYIRSATHRIIRHRNWLIIAPIENKAAEMVIIDGEGNWDYPGGTLHLEKLSSPKISTSNQMATLSAGRIHFPLVLRKWKKGDYFYPLGLKKKKKVSRFLIDQKLSLSDKEKIWVLEMDQKIIWILGQRIDDRFKVLDTTQEVLKITIG